MQNVKTSVTKLKDGAQNDAVSTCTVTSFSSSGNRGSHLQKGKSIGLPRPHQRNQTRT